MNNNVGFIYALINPSLSGLVKVGKTKRDTQERANELSGTTGVPTPFIVAYEIFVSDCTQAEKYLHTLLETKGYRISQNREFFNIQLKELIPIMIEVQKKYPANIGNNTNNNIEDFNETNDPGNELLSEAMKYYNGDEDYLQDYSEAIRLDSKNTDLYLELAKIQTKQREIGKALDTYRLGIQVSTKDYRPYYEAALLLRDNKQYNDAEYMFKQALSLQSNNDEIRNQLGAVMAINFVHSPQELRH